jgi:hypothetical protein
MPASSSTPRRARAAQVLSTLLFVVAIGFAAAAAWIWYSDDADSGPGTPPPARSAEEIDLAQVLAVLDTTDDGWDYGRSPATVRSSQIEVPGQHLTLGDAHLYVFIFTGPDAEARVAAREDAGAQLDPETMTLTTPSGQEANPDGAPLAVSQHSSVIAILVGGDESLFGEVDAALANLP